MGLFDDQGEKTEQATSRKLEKAYQRGQFARSAEVQTVFVLLAGLLALRFVWQDSWQRLAGFTAYILGHLNGVPLSPGMLHIYVLDGAWLLLQSVGPVVVATLIGGLLAGSIQNRFHTAPEALEPDWNRVNPVEGFKRVFSMQSAVPTATAATKLAVIIFLSYSVVKEILADPIFSSAVGIVRIGQFMIEAAMKIFLRVIAALTVVAVADYGYQYWRTNRDLMMTKDELKEELKQSQANPQMRSRQRRWRFRASFRRMLADVPRADVVVTNPTRLAIALRYDRRTMRAPRIVAKGARLNAARIREVAQQHAIPIIENKPVAQMIYKYGRVGAEIPTQLYTAVAEILAWVYRVNRYRYYSELNQVKV
jgi:flagellar biosynthetic protein FlhB